VGGICNTDLELVRGYYGFRGTPGHEFVGEVVASDERRLVGRRVVGEINLACGACEWCARGLGRHCPTRTVLGIVNQPGAFSELFTLPDRNLHVVPDAIATEHAAFLEPLAAACEILDQVAIPPAAEVALLGRGKLGSLVEQVLTAHGAIVHAYDRQADKPAHAYDWVVDASGSAEGLGQAARMVRPRGTVIMKSTLHGPAAIDTAPLIVNEITLVGSRCGRFEAALALLGSPGGSQIRLDPLIAARYPLADASAAFERAGRRGELKVLLIN
jgi:alcohol dehydrogenase